MLKYQVKLFFFKLILWCYKVNLLNDYEYFKSSRHSESVIYDFWKKTHVKNTRYNNTSIAQHSCKILLYYC